MCTAVMRFDRLHLRFFTCFFTTCINNHAMRLTHIWIWIALQLSPRKYLSGKFCFSLLKSLCEASHNTNRQLKTDLNLRPIHHKKDDRSDAHLFLGLLSYWIVNTIRYKLKQTGETCFWTEIVRRLSTQKAVTTEVTNALGEKVHMRLCSEPNKSAL